jgi:predicted nucleic acid-binding protein
VRALLDTSFFVATESGRPLGRLEGVTDTEVTADDDDRPIRVATLSDVESTWDPLPVDAEVARPFAHIAAALRAAGRRVPILDALVAATAIVEQIPVATQDNDYVAISGVEVIRV